jgi:hypothetical protein
LGSTALFSNTTGFYNVALGNESLYSNTTASNNTAVGYQAGYSNQTGSSNTLIGYTAGFSLTTGTNNTIVGPSTPTSATGYLMTTGSKNTILGGFSGNQGGLDIRTASNYIVLSDGDGYPAFWGKGGSDGYMRLQAGRLEFPATQNASTDANTLDDYDEYTAASAACTGAITTAAVWKLTKVGNLVTLVWPSVTGTAAGTTYYFAAGTLLPAKYRPSAAVSAAYLSTQNTVLSLATVTISTDGNMVFYASAAVSTPNFTNGVTVGTANNFAASWTI